MLRKTTHYELSKPDYNETADIEVVNSNMDIIDGALYELKEDLVNKNNSFETLVFKEKFIPYEMNFSVGNLYPSTGEFSNNLNNRIASKNSMKTKRRITIKIKDGFRVFICVNLGTTWSGIWHTNETTIGEGIEFKLIIARVTENESEIASIDEFLSNITFVNGIESILSKHQEKILICDVNTPNVKVGYVTSTGGVNNDNTRFRRFGISNIKSDNIFVYTGNVLPEVCPLAVFYNNKSQIIGTYTPSFEGSFKMFRNLHIPFPSGTYTIVFNWFYRYSNFPLSLYRVDKIVEEQNKNVLDGVKLCVNGDSVSTDTAGRWCVMLNGIYPLGKYTNIAVGGTTIIDQINSQDRVNQIPTDTDIIITGGTTNDWAKNKTIGSMSTLDDSSTLYGALHLYFQRLNARVPNAMKVMFSNSLAVFPNRFSQSHNPQIGIYNNLDKPMIDYIKAVKEVCEFDSIYYIPVYEECGIDIFNYENYVSNETPEGSSYQVFAHPNEEGAIKMTKVFRDYLERYYNAFKNL